MSDIKWGCVQPLIGGMYFGAEKAIGHPAEWIISFPGFCSHKEKDGEVTSCKNEYHLLRYLKEHEKLPPYYVFNRHPFTDYKTEKDPFNPTFLKNDFNDSVEFKNDGVDVVVAVPVCSGLSNATYTATEETKMLRNCNMKYITEYVLKVIKPKAYIFENAPSLFSSSGDEIRTYLNKVAEENKYSVTYYKTDTLLHHNAQRRQRTFVIMWKWKGDEMQPPPKMNFCDDRISVKDFLDEMPDYDEKRVPEMQYFNKVQIDYMMDTHKNWRELLLNESCMHYIIFNNEKERFIEYCKSYDFENEKERALVIKNVEHAEKKKNDGSWIFDTTPSVTGSEFIKTVMHKNIYSKIHPFKDRLFTVGELLYLMGMPTDFKVYGGYEEVRSQIGQNVPANTAAFLISEMVRVIDDWDREEASEINFFNASNVEFVDNISKTTFVK